MKIIFTSTCRLDYKRAETCKHYHRGWKKCTFRWYSGNNASDRLYGPHFALASKQVDVRESVIDKEG